MKILKKACSSSVFVVVVVLLVFWNALGICQLLVCLGPSGDHETASSALMWIIEFHRFPLFSVLLEGTTEPNCSYASPNSACSLWSNPPNASSSDHYFTSLCQLLALAQGHHASVPCFYGLVHFSCLAVAISRHQQQHIHLTSGLQLDWLFWVTFSQNQ